MTKTKRRWLVIAVVCSGVSLAVVHYLLYVQPSRVTVPLAFQRLTLLNLNEPAPGLESIKLKSLPAVIIFCDYCDEPAEIEAEVKIASNPNLAQQYGLKAADGTIGPGYAIIDTKGMVRYVTFDDQLDKHTGEINRIVRGLR